MTQPIYLLAGSPASGKSWVCNQLKDKFIYIAHDLYLNEFTKYLHAIKENARYGKKPVLTEAPFSVSKTQEPLEVAKLKVVNVYIVEDPKVLSERYEKDRKEQIPKGHLTRQNTYLERAKLQRAFVGNSNQVLQYLRNVK